LECVGPCERYVKSTGNLIGNRCFSLAAVNFLGFGLEKIFKMKETSKMRGLLPCIWWFDIRDRGSRRERWERRTALFLFFFVFFSKFFSGVLLFLSFIAF